jgi:hypothetical protein
MNNNNMEEEERLKRAAMNADSIARSFATPPSSRKSDPASFS